MAAPPSPRTRALTGSDLAIVIAIGAIVGVTLAVWLTGELAGLIASGRPAPVGARDLGHILIRLPDHLADPAHAWPAHARRLLPSPAVFYLAALLVFTALALLTALVMRWWRSAGLGARGRGGPQDGDRRAAWTHTGELRELAVRRAKRGRLILGRTRPRGRLLATPPDTHLALVAPTRSGKTSARDHPLAARARRPRRRALHQARRAPRHAGAPPRAGPGVAV